MKKKLIGTLLFIIGSLPLFIYPLVLIANIMSIAGESSGDTPIILSIVFFSFIFFSTIYPLTYILGLILFIIKQRYIFAILPLLHLLITLMLYIAWGAVDS